MARIEVVAPRADWADEFVEIAASLRALLDRAGVVVTEIEHIGSTAVPGLAAKDVIDIQVGISDLDDERLAAAMVVSGYRWWGDIHRDHQPPGQTIPLDELTKRFASQGDHGRPTNIHFRVPGRFNHRYALLCRDYLRTHRTAADAYGEVKRNLARLFPDDVEAYYDVKDPVFDVIMAGAEDWAAVTGWRPHAT
ncbi:MAG: GrpB protein [Acidimicrobiales bacterium]|nr:GrpB protein [Acidimicrobiales bacterium]